MRVLAAIGAFLLTASAFGQTTSVGPTLIEYDATGGVDALNYRTGDALFGWDRFIAKHEPTAEVNTLTVPITGSFNWVYGIARLTATSGFQAVLRVNNDATTNYISTTTNDGWYLALSTSQVVRFSYDNSSAPLFEILSFNTSNNLSRIPAHLGTNITITNLSLSTDPVNLEVGSHLTIRGIVK